MKKEQFKVNLYFEENGEKIEKVISDYLINEIKNKNIQEKYNLKQKNR